MYTIVYHSRVGKEDVPRLDQTDKRRILSAIESKLAHNPLLYGGPLHGVLKQYWKLRVGNFRVIYSIYGTEVRVFAVGHRKNVYKMIERLV